MIAISKPTTIVHASHGQVFANSEDIALCFNKRHADILRGIRLLIDQEVSLQRNFAFMSKPIIVGNGATREVATCNMTRDGFTLLAMGFTGKLALQWKIKYLEAFNQMERQLSYANRPNPIDQIDYGLDLLITAETALHATEWIDARERAAIRGTIEQAIRHIQPARDHLDEI